MDNNYIKRRFYIIVDEKKRQQLQTWCLQASVEIRLQASASSGAAFFKVSAVVDLSSQVTRLLFLT